MKVLHKYEVGIIMGVGGVILPLSMVLMIDFHELSCSKCMPIIFRYTLTSYKCLGCVVLLKTQIYFYLGHVYNIQPKNFLIARYR